MSPISAATIIRRNPDLIAAAVGEETILLDATSWTYIHFNETAARIWECLDRPRSVGDVAEALRSDYEIDDAACVAAVEEFAAEMSGRGFIVIDAA